MDNEIPLSQIDSPLSQGSSQNIQMNAVRSFRHHKQKARDAAAGDAASADAVDIMTQNLPDDELNDENIVVGTSEVVAAVAAIAATNKAREIHNRSGSYNNLFNAEYDSSAVNTPMTTSPGIGENMEAERFYKGEPSNLLAAAVLGINNTEQEPHLIKSISQTENMYCNVPNEIDPNLHVYSNLIDERHQQQQKQHNQIPNSSDVLSSTLLNDDLDLDDPVSASFVAKKPPRKNANQTRKIFEEPKVSVEMTPSRMRILHDTTMIDTALDLDSLDGTSLGNNSQSCLVKSSSKAPIV